MDRAMATGLDTLPNWPCVPCVPRVLFILFAAALCIVVWQGREETECGDSCGGAEATIERAKYSTYPAPHHPH